MTADIVSVSSRLIAAARAIESERKDALFVDPFAAVLAGVVWVAADQTRGKSHAASYDIPHLQAQKR